MRHHRAGTMYGQNLTMPPERSDPGISVLLRWRSERDFVEQLVQGAAGLHFYVQQVEQGETGFQIVNKWNKDSGSVQMKLSTCSKVGLQGRGTFYCT